MPISEAARADLYTGLAEVLGPQRAEILMTYLPSFDPSEIASKADLAILRSNFENRFDQVDRRFDQLEVRMLGIDRRLDRLFLTLLAGMFVIVAAMASVIFTVG